MIEESEVKTRLEAQGIEIIKCRDCKREIIWLRTKTGKLMPMTLELQSHFIDCPGATQFRRRS